MIPSLAMVRVGGRRRKVRLWLPLFLLWPVLLPFAVVLAVAAAIVVRPYGVAGARALHAIWLVAAGLRGLAVELDSPDFAFQIRFV